MGLRAGSRLKRAYARCLVLPFDTTIGVLAFIGGLVGLLKVGITADALQAYIGNWINGFQLIYCLAGFLMLLGIARGKAWIEAPGLVLLAVVVIVRNIALVWFFHAGSIVWVSLVFNTVIVWACWVRTRSLMRVERIALMQVEL